MQMKRLCTLIYFFCLLALCSHAQDKLSKLEQDSICKHAKKMKEPKRQIIEFPSKPVSDEDKLMALKKALPDSLSNANNPLHWFYTYYFEAPVTDYDPVGDSLTYLNSNPMKFKLNNTFFFDINGDGLMDFIHYPIYYRALYLSHDSYEIFIQNKDGSYTMLQFEGFITKIEFNKNNSFKKLNTYRGACCTNKENYFYTYCFNKSKNSLLIKESNLILTCQFNNQ